MRQFRLVHVGVAAALAAATVTALGLVQAVGAADGQTSVFVPITPCRLADTRTGTDNVGTRATPIGAGEVATFDVWGTNGGCTIPNTATGIASNATAVNPTSSSYVTIFPADANPRPTTSNLNFTAGAAPTPNQVTVRLSATGAIGAFNNAGRVDMIIDIVGYYVPSTTGSGPVGPAGPQGPQGLQGLQGLPGTNGTPGPACPTSGCVAFYTGGDAYNYTSANRFVDSFGCLTLDTNGYAFLDLNLPTGALLDSVRIRYRDSGAGSTSRTEYRLLSSTEQASTTTFSSVLISPDSSGIGVAMLQLNPVRPAQARDSQYRINMNIYGSSQLFCGAEVGYHF